MDHPAHMSQLSAVTAMACSGLVLAAVVPGVVSGLRHSPLWERLSVHPGLALPLLVLSHAWAVLGDALGLRPAGGAWVTGPVLTATAVLFWIPVMARTRHRLGDAGRCLYLFLGMPLLDLPALGVIATGRSPEGLAMIVGMLPIGIIAAAQTWSWARREERLAANDLPPAASGDAHAR